jgi:spermidine synthase
LLAPTLILLSALGPVAVRLTATGAADSGRRSGDAWAVSTAGSVIGAILAGFVLIPHLPLSRIILGAAVVLLILGAIGSWLSQRAVPVAQLAACAACVGLALQPQAKPKFAAYATESAYGRIAVLDNGARRYLLVNGTSQSIMENDGGESESQYVRSLEWTRALRPKAKDVLVVGLGAGLLPKALERRGMIADSVEIDPAIADAATKYFGYQPKGGLFVGDGRAAVELAQKKWDVAFLDAFGAESPPTHLFTQEYFESVRAKLTQDGVFAINIVSSVDGRDDRPWKAVYRTLKSVYPNVRAFVGNDPNEGLANVLLFASEGPLQAGPPASPERSKKEVALMLTRELTLSPRELDEAVLLTDDYAPLDSLMAGTSRRWRALLQKAMPELLLD